MTRCCRFRRCLVALLAGYAVLAQDPAPADHRRSVVRHSFEGIELGVVPPGFLAAETRTAGNPASWRVESAADAPDGRQQLAVASSNQGRTFNLLLSEAEHPADLALAVWVRANAGKEDQGGGLVWRARDADNYYVARWNPLEVNVRLYKVENGERTMFANADVAADPGAWHQLSVTMRGQEIVVALDSKAVIQSRDATFAGAGKIGLWTKADASTRFDLLEAAVAPVVPAADQSAPRQVFVVNTQDAAVSLVDLATMQELQRYPVGDRPYGIAVSKDGKTVAIGVEGEECVKFFSLPDFKLQGQTPIGKMFNDHMVLTQDGKHVLVANYYSDAVVGIDLESMQVAFRIKDCSAPHVVKYGPLKRHAFVTCKKVTGIAVIDPGSAKLVKFIGLNVNPRSLTFSPDEQRIYFGSFWVDGFFELDLESGKVTRLLEFDPPAGSADPQEVTYHGVEMLNDTVLVAANEGRSYVDAVDVTTGKLLDRLTAVSKPCCVERIPGQSGQGVRFLISNIGDGTLQLAELTDEGKLTVLGKAQVGKAPKRVAFLR